MPSQTNLASALHLLESFHDNLPSDLKSLKAITQFEEQNQQLKIILTMPFLWQQGFEQMKIIIEPKIKALIGEISICWHLKYRIATLASKIQLQKPLPRIKNVKNIIAVSSGKGGVGKSSTAVNLALALKKLGAKVGLLDADIYGPSIPNMLGTQGKPILSPDNQHMAPIEIYGIQTQSVGYLTSQDGAMIWRGPMASKALLQMLNDTLWNELDYLVLDLPPGTGDIQLTIGQNIPVTGSIIVTTPQDIALIDVKKGITAFKKVNVPVIGIVENMSYHLCVNCGHQDAIFGEGGALALSEAEQIALLAQIPLDKAIRSDLDEGQPTVEREPASAITQIYTQLAEKISIELYRQNIPILDDVSVKNI